MNELINNATNRVIKGISLEKKVDEKGNILQTENRYS